MSVSSRNFGACTVPTVILCGSHVRGDATTESDAFADLERRDGVVHTLFVEALAPGASLETLLALVHRIAGEEPRE